MSFRNILFPFKNILCLIRKEIIQKSQNVSLIQNIVYNNFPVLHNVTFRHLYRTIYCIIHVIYGPDNKRWCATVSQLGKKYII